MRYLPGLLLLAAISCTAARMNVEDLYKMCTSSNASDKTACTFYLLGVFEGAGLVAGTTKDNGTGTFRDVKDKPFCVPEGLSSTAMELVASDKVKEAGLRNAIAEYTLAIDLDPKFKNALANRLNKSHNVSVF
jgi:hypothetical protein